MTEDEHRRRIQAIEAETAAIKKNISELDEQIRRQEFQHKKDIVESDRRFWANQNALEKKQDRSQRQIDHLIKLVGLTYDELDEIDATLTETGVVLTRPRKRARTK